MDRWSYNQNEETKNKYCIGISLWVLFLSPTGPVTTELRCSCGWCWCRCSISCIFPKHASNVYTVIPGTSQLHKSYVLPYPKCTKVMCCRIQSHKNKWVSATVLFALFYNVKTQGSKLSSSLSSTIASWHSLVSASTFPLSISFHRACRNDVR